MRKSALSVYQDAQLWLELYVPLVFYQELEPVNDEPAPFIWTETDIITVAEGILKHSISAILGDRRSQYEREDALNWINRPPPPYSETDRHFSFWMCCQLTGVDHEAMHDLVINQLKAKERKARKLQPSSGKASTRMIPGKTRRNGNETAYGFAPSCCGVDGSCH